MLPSILPPDGVKSTAMSHTFLRLSVLILKMSVDLHISITPQSRIPLRKLLVPLLVKKFSAFHETGPFINPYPANVENMVSS
jgi:hypothetical protein